MILQALVSITKIWKSKERFQREDGVQEKFLMVFNCHTTERFKLF